jgi:hypothetical protein
MVKIGIFVGEEFTGDVRNFMGGIDVEVGRWDF